MLNQEDPGRFSRALQYFQYMNRAQASQIDDFREVVVALDANKAQTQEQTTVLKGQQSKLQEQRQGLAKKKAERSAVLAKLNKELTTQDARLSQMTADREALQKVVDHVKNALVVVAPPPTPTPKTPAKKVSQASKKIVPVVKRSTKKPFKPHLAFQKRKGKMNWPSRGKVLARYGSMDSSRRQRWDGMVIGAVEGDQVQAIHKGRVVFSNWLRGYGLLMIVDHGKGFMSLYGRNRTLYKTTGDWVNAGDIIAEVGNTGGFETSSLYFEIRYKGSTKNPMHWLAASQ